MSSEIFDKLAGWYRDFIVQCKNDPRIGRGSARAAAAEALALSGQAQGQTVISSEGLTQNKQQLQDVLRDAFRMAQRRPNSLEFTAKQLTTSMNAQVGDWAGEIPGYQTEPANARSYYESLFNRQKLAQVLLGILSITKLRKS